MLLSSPCPIIWPGWSGRFAAIDPTVIELREWSRIAEDLGAERIRLTNRMREQLWHYFPAVLELDSDLGAEWLLQLWEEVPTPIVGSIN